MAGRGGYQAPAKPAAVSGPGRFSQRTDSAPKFRSVQHDRSKIEPAERDTFDEYSPKLKDSTYGSDEYKGFLAAMKPALDHHYAANRHHPEHFADGVNGMTLVDLIEMLADWKAAGERHADGSLRRSLEIQRDRFGLSDQLLRILTNTAEHFGWLEPET